ncbi:MAG: Ribonuclease Z [Chlamydiia bacterium]|nr:Ribonuclease Z [Chlamydiia bacterium]MCH9618517.1 Ribonuclease Z [Chlamydiia bacterium]MCH9623806.1 Ribonuclease Z [Chlamydiia bacterium]
MSVRDLTILGSSSQQPTRMRNHGAYLLRWNGEGFLFDPGEGTQRQFIHAGIAPPTVTRIFISHFHGDHCLGFGSMLMRLNLDGASHEIHCYYPKSGKKYFDRLRYSTIYHEKITVVEHPIDQAGVVHDDGEFCISAEFLDHGVDNLAYRVQEKDERKYYREKLVELGIKGEAMRTLRETGSVKIDGKVIEQDEVSYIRQGDSFAYISDTKVCAGAKKIAEGATMLLSESTYLDEAKVMAEKHRHLTCKQAAQIAKDAGVLMLILTHFSARYLDLSLFEQEARAIFPNSFVAKDLIKFPFKKSF